MENKYLQYFLVFSGALFLINLLIMNDFTSFLIAPEIAILHTENLQPILPAFIVSFFSSLRESEFVVRLSQVFILLLSFLGIYFFGKKIFGAKTIRNTLLILASCFLLVNLSKFLNADIYLFALQTLSGLSIYLFLKKPSTNLKILIWFLTILGAFVAPVNMALWICGITVMLFFFHVDGKKMKELHLWFIWSVLIVLLQYFDSLEVDGNAFFIPWKVNALDDYFLFLLIGLLPWLGFLPAALWDTFQKIRRGEELAKLGSIWMLMSLFTLSFSIVFMFSLLIAKQIENYFTKNYPYRNLIKIFCILNLIATFFILTMTMIKGHLIFGATGFRSGMGLSIMYWIPSFVGIIGLFMMDKRVVMGGFVMAGLLFTFFGWSMLNPLVEQIRSAEKQIILFAKKIKTEEAKKIYMAISDEKKEQLVTTYAKFNNLETEQLQNLTDLISVREMSRGEAVFILDENHFDALKLKQNSSNIIKEFVNYQAIQNWEERFWLVK